MMTQHFSIRGPRKFRNPALLFSLLCSVGCSADGEKKISLDAAAAIANRAVAQIMVDGRFKPQRVEIAEESERHMTNRCLAESWDDPREVARVQAIREKLVNRKFYILRYGPPLPYHESNGGLVTFNGWEHCVFVDSGTGEVLGVIAL